MSTGARSANNSRSKSIVGRPCDLPIKQVDSPLAAADVQGAVVEKGIEVMGKMVDKQLQIIDEAQQKAENFLKKEVRSCNFNAWQSFDEFKIKVKRSVARAKPHNYGIHAFVSSRSSRLAARFAGDDVARRPSLQSPWLTFILFVPN